MPPKKKTKTALTPARDQSSPAAAAHEGLTPTPTTHAHGHAKEQVQKEQVQPEPVVSDGWTDEQETTLFKAVSVYNMKPAGMHKHFRMIAIAELMKNHGVAAEHTNIPGIWAKLRTLYNLDGLDEREDISEDGLESDHWTEFALPLDDFGEAMMARRFNTEGSRSVSPAAVKERTQTPGGAREVVTGRTKRVTESPSGTSSLALTESGIEDTEDDKSIASAPTKRGRGRPLGSTKARGRGATARAGTGRGRGRPRKETREPEPVVEEEDEDDEDEEEDEDDDDDDEDDEEDDDETEDELDSDDSDDRQSTSPEATVTTTSSVKRGRGRPPGATNRGGRGGRRSERGKNDVRRSKRNK